MSTSAERKPAGQAVRRVLAQHRVTGIRPTCAMAPHRGPGHGVHGELCQPLRPRGFRQQPVSREASSARPGVAPGRIPASGRLPLASAEQPAAGPGRWGQGAMRQGRLGLKPLMAVPAGAIIPAVLVVMHRLAVGHLPNLPAR
jgi:hypothetical protein